MDFLSLWMAENYWIMGGLSYFLPEKFLLLQNNQKISWECSAVWAAYQRENWMAVNKYINFHSTNFQSSNFQSNNFHTWNFHSSNFQTWNFHSSNFQTCNLFAHPIFKLAIKMISQFSHLQLKKSCNFRNKNSSNFQTCYLFFIQFSHI